MNRRTFCWSAAAFAASARTGWGLSESNTRKMVRSVDRARVLRLAAQWATAKPETITAFPKPKDRPGGPHDYASDADYFWPNQKNPNGPFINRDGMSNPTNFNAHRLALIRMSRAVAALTAGYVLTGNRHWSEAATAHLRAWFVDPATRMNPNLQYAQGIRNGGPTGRSYGIIDTLHLSEVARSAEWLRPTMPDDVLNGTLAWFRAYLQWMETSANGIKERDATNNHGLAWGMQAACFAHLLDEKMTLAAVKNRWQTVQLPMQMAENGSFPREIARTKPYGYSIFTFDVAATTCWVIGDESFALPDGRGMCKAAAWLEPYLADKASWPFRHDVEHWQSWPVRSPGLLFCGISCSKDAYLDLWKRLDPDPTDPEVIRNFPVRQPVLWV